ncbi:hypothetical protein TorRG33x02_217210 [Trema orientale]|uniref:Uncharacterized protein n=1 Tax=Trema orientale TaxID=63057 RepID=A0A2P5EAC0_TREOI|nr:hypothetical protein TorRG33x02_217210 [Trema orientale]
MEVESPPGFGLYSDEEADSEKRSIPELISDLRTAFRMVDFDRVEEILVTREEKLKRKITKMEASLNFEQCEKLQAELELEKLKAESAQKRILRENFEAMQERVRMAEERERLVDERAKEADQRAKSAQERLERLLREVKKEEGDKVNEIVEIREKNRELESAKMRAEGDIEVWKRKFEEMEIRVLRLEAETVEILKMETLVSGEMAMDSSGSNKANEEKGACESGGFAVDLGSPSKGNCKSASEQAIVIIDSDDDSAPGSTIHGKEISRKLSNNKPIDLTGLEIRPRVLKRKRALFPNENENESKSNGSPVTTNDAEKQNVVLVQCEEKTAEERSSPSFIKKLTGCVIDDPDLEVSSCSSDSDSDINIDEIIL